MGRSDFFFCKKMKRTWQAKSITDDIAKDKNKLTVVFFFLSTEQMNMRTRSDLQTDKETN